MVGCQEERRKEKERRAGNKGERARMMMETGARRYSQLVCVREARAMAGFGPLLRYSGQRGLCGRAGMGLGAGSQRPFDYVHVPSAVRREEVAASKLQCRYLVRTCRDCAS